jgi:hypothetical protein
VPSAEAVTVDSEIEVEGPVHSEADLELFFAMNEPNEL